MSLTYDRHEPTRISQRSTGVTAFAPSFPSPIQLPKLGRSAVFETGADGDFDPATLDLRALPAHKLSPGTVVGDFEIVRWLGRGASGTVYLTRQVSLDRHVALKITANIGGEARAMATLEHPHIVTVFSQTVDSENDVRLMCMQFVPGATLADVAARLKELPISRLSGASLLETLDGLSQGAASFHAAELRHRQEIAAASYVEAVCSIVAKVADALHFAHQRNVLHRDVKPANILIDPYGRPLLADFSLSISGAGSDSPSEETFGGTLAYMAPEHLEAFNPESPVTSESVDARSDIYSLGVVLYELLTLELPFSAPPPGRLNGEALTRLALARRLPFTFRRDRFPEISIALAGVVDRCLAADPAKRFQSAGELAERLDGCRLLSQAVGRLPVHGTFAKTIDRRPLTSLIGLSFIPHIIGSLFAASYNAFVLFPRLGEEQQTAFVTTAAIDCGVAFPLAAVAVIALYAKSVSIWRRLDGNDRPSSAEVDNARRRLAETPLAGVVISLCGWLSPMLAIPLGMAAAGANMSWLELGRLATSLLLGFLIAAIYGYFISQAIVVRRFYPRAWLNAARFSETARQELSRAPNWLRRFQIGAGVAPLAGAIMIVGAEPTWFAGNLTPESDVAYRWLAVALILLGAAGIWLSQAMGSLILKSFDALTRPEL